MKNISFTVLAFAVLAFAVVLSLGSCSSSMGTNETVAVVGTFNMEWLGDGKEDRKPRTDQDYLMLADVVIKSQADVLGVQEIENVEALRKVLRYLDGYDGFVSFGGGQQRVGVIYKKDVKVQRLGDYTPLDLGRPDRLRPGLLISCKKGNFDWTQMIVHLKSTSRYDSTAAMTEESREIRTKQAEILRAWSDSITTNAKDKDVIITGDLNDFPQRKQNPTLSSLVAAPNLIFLTRELKSCANAKWNAIDHVVASVTAALRYQKGTEYVENFRDFLSEQDASKVSDHCPVVVRFESTTIDD